MGIPTNLLGAVGINHNPSAIMHIDLNSCFATIEQQSNPLLRGKRVAVAAYTTPNGCILAPSVEAKTLGIKCGMRVREGKHLCPDLIILPPDPGKYRFVNRKLLQLLRTYCPEVEIKSIDEMNLDFTHIPPLERELHHIAQEIKAAIRREIGEWMTVSIGIAPNRFLAKLAANLHKPDGLDEINAANLRTVWPNWQPICTSLMAWTRSTLPICEQCWRQWVWPTFSVSSTGMRRGFFGRASILR